MAKRTTAIFLLLTTLNMASGSEDSEHKIIYVSLLGQDSKYCGSDIKPCRSIAHAVQRVDWGGHIFLDGNGTERHPFDCEAHDQHPGIYIDKSVTMEGFRDTPFVSCHGGLHFLKSVKRHSWRPKILLSGIAFRQTSLTFEDCSTVELTNCSHQHAITAISVLMKHSSSLHFNIQGPSLFQNNSHCVQAVLFEKTVSYSLTMNLKDVDFHDNGIFRGTSLLLRSLITITTHVRKPSKHSFIHTSLYNITCSRNHAAFLNIDVPLCTTKESYSNIKLVNNNLGQHTSHSWERNRLLDSMFTSLARKTQILFSDLQCVHNSNNQFLRCIKVLAVVAEVTIKDSLFVGQVIVKDGGAAVFLETLSRASLEVFNTSFQRNMANSGGAVFVNSRSGTLTLNLTEVNFTECRAVNGGCAVLVGKPPKQRTKSVAFRLYAHITNVQVTHCKSTRNATTRQKMCGSMCIRLRSGIVKVTRSLWSQNIQTRDGALFIESTGGKVAVDISESVFIENRINNGAIVKITAILSRHSGRLSITNTSMERNEESALEVSSKYSIRLINVTIASCKSGLQVFGRRERGHYFPANILIDGSTFKGNTYDALFNMQDPTSVQLAISNTIFTADGSKTTKGSAIRVFITGESSRAQVNVVNVSFNARPSSSFVFYFTGKKTLTVQRSIFRNCISHYREEWSFGKNKSIYETGTGAVSVLMIPDKPYHLGCVQSDDHNNTHPLWRYDSHVIFEDTLFQENAGLIAGAVYLSNGNTTFHNCTFLDNLGTPTAAQVHSAYGTGQVKFSNCSFLRTRKDVESNGSSFQTCAFFSSASGGPIRFQNTSMLSVIGQKRSSPVVTISSGGYVDIDQHSTIKCSQGSRLVFENNTHTAYTEKRKRFCRLNVTALKYTCMLCPSGFYSLQTGKSRGLFVDERFECLPCPFGATCGDEKNVAAKANFWGSLDPKNPTKLTFLSCPDNYCQSPNADSADYNSCRGNRYGALCGQCAVGFTETLLSADCVRADECDNYWLWIVMILFTTLLAIYLLKKPPIMAILKKQILWFKGRQESQVGESPSQEHGLSDLGYLKIVFYFYQAGELLIDTSLHRLLHEAPFIYIVVATFNLKVGNITKGIGSLCPFAGLTAVTKQLLLSVVVFVAIGNVVIIYCMHFVINSCRRKQKPALTKYMAASPEIILLGYIRLAETSLNLLRCVSIGPEMRLFVDGNIKCWLWWQYILLAYIVGFIVPLIAVLYLGSYKLHKASVSNAFLIACVFPLPFLIYWILTDTFRRREDESTVRHIDNKAVTKMLQDPFRPPDDKDHGTLYWESVLIGRRFIILTFHTFIPDPMFRFVCLAAACQLMTVHHVVKCPYRDTTANRLEALSLVTLTVIAIINVAKATLVSSGIEAQGPNRYYLEGMQWFQVCALGIVPALLCLLAVFAVLSQIVRLVMLAFKYITIHCRQVTTAHRLPDELRTELTADA